jgi:hypothetical protein
MTSYASSSVAIPSDIFEFTYYINHIGTVVENTIITSIFIKKEVVSPVSIVALEMYFRTVFCYLFLF